MSSGSPYGIPAGSRPGVAAARPGDARHWRRVRHFEGVLPASGAPPLPPWRALHGCVRAARVARKGTRPQILDPGAGDLADPASISDREYIDAHSTNAHYADIGIMGIMRLPRLCRADGENAVR